MTKTTVKISKKGQIVIPKPFRDKLHTNILELEMNENEIKIRPSESIVKLSGVLKNYKKKSIEYKEQEAWSGHVAEKHKTDRY